VPPWRMASAGAIRTDDESPWSGYGVNRPFNYWPLTQSLKGPCDRGNLCPAGEGTPPRAARLRELVGEARLGVAQGGQTWFATSTTRASLRHWSVSESSLPWTVEEKPHCGLSASWSSGT
jgi:hypothetical protein